MHQNRVRNNKMETPILFLIFNRPDTTQRVFDAIKQKKPKYLYVAADGPRKNKIGEDIKCMHTRNILKQIDWDCELKTLYRENNLGCGIAVSSAISWFFNNVESGIILEDDCLPDPSFFEYCKILLEFYKDDEEVMFISGNNFQNNIKRTEASYYFSKYSHIWGWASWRRAWNYYDYDMKTYPDFIKNNKLNSIFTNWLQKIETKKTLSRAYRKYYNTWDYQWSYAIWDHNGICIIPNTNLVSNIGFDERGTHTNTFDKRNSAIELNSIDFPLIHPINKEVSIEADYYTFKKVLYTPVLLKIKSLILNFNKKK
jgi:hypothetical protein